MNGPVTKPLMDVLQEAGVHPDDFDFVDLYSISMRLEDITGFDSIRTVKTHYGVDKICLPPYACTYPWCKFHRRDPQLMWQHVHFFHDPGGAFRAALLALLRNEALS